MRAMVDARASLAASARADRCAGIHRASSTARRSARERTVARVGFFETFDGDAVLAVKDAMDQAKRLRSSELGSEHVLLALTRARDRTSKALHKGGVTEESTRRALGERAGVSELELMNPFNKPSVEGLLPLRDELKRVFERASGSASEVGSKELALAMIDDETCGAAETMRDLEVDVKVMRKEITGANARELVGAGKKNRKAKKQTLAECSIDLTAEAREGKLDPVLGRDEEVTRVMRLSLIHI